MRDEILKTILHFLTMVTDQIANHFMQIFETLVLLGIWAYGAWFLAKSGEHMALVGWLTGGAAVAALLRGLNGNGGGANVSVSGSGANVSANTNSADQPPKPPTP